VINRCVACGEPVPEGRMVCPSCNGEIDDVCKERKTLELIIGAACVKSAATESRKEDRE